MTMAKGKKMDSTCSGNDLLIVRIAGSRSAKKTARNAEW